MTITTRVQAQLFGPSELRPIRIAPSTVLPPPRSHDHATDDLPAIASRGTPWSTDEHERFLDALARFPYGPWKRIAAHVGSRTPRQTMSHAQKYRQKINRRKHYAAHHAVERTRPTCVVPVSALVHACVQPLTNTAVAQPAAAAPATHGRTWSELSGLAGVSSDAAYVGDASKLLCGSADSLALADGCSCSGSSEHASVSWQQSRNASLSLSTPEVPLELLLQDPLDWFTFLLAATTDDDRGVGGSASASAHPTSSGHDYAWCVA